MKRHLSILACLLLVFAMVLTLASCEWILPKEEHTHDFQDGKCECGEVDPDYKPECTEHAWSVEVTTEATCTEPGEKTLTCTECGATEKQEIAANGHTEENVPGKAPTCLAPGLTSGKKCSVCGETLKAQEEIPTSGHNFVEGACSVCGEVDPNYNGPRTYEWNFGLVDGSAAKDKTYIADGTTYVDGYFTTIGEVYYRYKDNAVYCVEVEKEGRGAIQFTVAGTATVEVQFSSTGGSNTSWIGIIDAEGNIVANNEGVNTVTGANDGKTVFTYTLSAGTYRVVSPLIKEPVLDADGNPTYDEEGNPVEKNPYSRAARVYYVKVTETPAEEAPANEIKVVTTDTYGWFDEYTFVAEKSGKYTFTVPADLGLYSVASYDAWGAPEVDYMHYEYTSEPHTVTVALAAGAEYKFYVGAFSKAEWIITWTCEEGDVGGGDDPVDPPVDNNPVLNLGSNSVKVDEAHVTDGVDYTFVAEVDGTYTFGGDLLAIVFDETGTQQIGRGQVSLTAGTYIVKLVPLMGAGTYNVNVSVEGAGEAGEPDGSEANPYVWETIPESVTLDYTVVSGKVYYIFTATADGAVTFTWPVEGDSWFDYFELDENGNLLNNSGSGFMATSHSFVVEAGKSYRVSIGSWAEAGSHTITIAFAACDHEWSEATCQVLSTCSKCGATTGDYADHIPNSENPTCSDPAECTVCGKEVGYVPHEWDDGVVTQQPDCANGTNGIKLLTCTVCGATQEEEIWAFHDMVVDEEVSATCTEDGHYKAHCSVCGYVEEYVSEAQGHYNYFEGTCGDTVACLECGADFTKEHDGSPATCTEPMYCYVCNQFVGEPLGHDFVDGVCSVCGEEAPEELKATIDNEFTSDKANSIHLAFSSGGAWGIYTNGVNKSGEFPGGIGGLDEAGKYITYEFYLSEAGTVDIIWSIAGSNWENGVPNLGIADMAANMTITIDGKEVDINGLALPAGTGSSTAEIWWNVQQFVLKDVQLDAGYHSFHCDIPAHGGLNVGSMTINSTSAIRVDYATVTNVDFIERDGKLYYALFIDMAGYSADDLAFWHDANTSYEIAAVETGDNGETIVMIDVSDFAVGTTVYPHMSFAGKNYVNDENLNGDVRGMGLQYEEKYVKFGDKYYGIAAAYTMPSLVVTTAVSQPTSADIVEENGSVYYILTYKVIGYDIDTFEFYDGNTIYVYDTPIVDGNNVTFRFNITDLTVDVWPHLRIDGTPWNGPGQNGDVKVACTTKTIELNGKTYTLKSQWDLPTVVIA